MKHSVFRGFAWEANEHFEWSRPSWPEEVARHGHDLTWPFFPVTVAANGYLFETTMVRGQTVIDKVHCDHRSVVSCMVQFEWFTVVQTQDYHHRRRWLSTYFDGLLGRETNERARKWLSSSRTIKQIDQVTQNTKTLPISGCVHQIRSLWVRPLSLCALFFLDDSVRRQRRRRSSWRECMLKYRSPGGYY